MTNVIRITNRDGDDEKVYFAIDLQAFIDAGANIGVIGRVMKSYGVFGPDNRLEILDGAHTMRETVEAWKGKEWGLTATDEQIEDAYTAMPWEELFVVEIVPIGSGVTEVSADDA